MKANASSDPKIISGKLRGAISTGKVKKHKHTGLHITIGVHRKDWDGEDYYPAYVEYGHGGPAPAAFPYKNTKNGFFTRLSFFAWNAIRAVCLFHPSPQTRPKPLCANSSQPIPHPSLHTPVLEYNSHRYKVHQYNCKIDK